MALDHHSVDDPLGLASLAGGKGTLQSVDRALHALEVVATAPQGITAKAVARRLGCTLSAAYNVLNTLVGAGYLVHLDESHGYALGYRVVGLFRALQDQLTVSPDVRDAVAWVHREADAAAYYAVFRDTDVVVAHVVDSARRPRIEPLDVGFDRAAHATAYGKLMLAAMPAAHRRAYLADVGLPRLTEDTVTNLERLESELREVRRAGVAVDVEELRPGLACMAAPVRLGGAVVGAVAISVPSGEFDGRRRQLEGAVRRGAAWVSDSAATA